jgi:hypothetical protein
MVDALFTGLERLLDEIGILFPLLASEIVLLAVIDFQAR